MKGETGYKQEWADGYRDALLGIQANPNGSMSYQAGYRRAVKKIGNRG